MLLVGGGGPRLLRGSPYTGQARARRNRVPPPGLGICAMQAQGAGRVQKCYVRGWPANDTLPPSLAFLSHFCPFLVSGSACRPGNTYSTCQESRSIYLGSQALAFTFTHFYYCSCWQGWAQPAASTGTLREAASCSPGVHSPCCLPSLPRPPPPAPWQPLFSTSSLF